MRGFERLLPEDRFANFLDESQLKRLQAELAAVQALPLEPTEPGAPDEKESNKVKLVEPPNGNAKRQLGGFRLNRF